MLNVLLSKLRKPVPEPESTEFENILNIAEKLASMPNPIPRLHDLQKLIMRPIQALHMSDAYRKPAHGAIDSLDDFKSFGIDSLPTLQKGFVEFLWYSCKAKESDIPTANLASDIVLPTPWSQSSMVNMLGFLGQHRGLRPFKEEDNHRLSWWYPLNIFWVQNGNHSIMQGILVGEGLITPVSGYDLTPLYNEVRFDGKFWVDRTGEQIGCPRYPELGYVYEIGRLILSKKYS